MKKSVPAASPDAYVAALNGWQRTMVEHLRAGVRESRSIAEVIKWRNLVYLSNGPMIVIRAEAHRVLFGFWRGQRLRDIEPRLTPGGKYEMATVELHEGDEVTKATIKRLTKEAIRLNEALGDPCAIT
jgi:hypothetical protein